MVAKIQRDADGRIPRFGIAYLRDQPFRNGAPRQPVYHAKMPDRVVAICDAAVIDSPIMHMPIGWKDARAGIAVSCPKCKTLIKRATDTRPKLKLKQPKEVKPKKPTREVKLANRRAALAAQSAEEIARLKAYTPPVPVPPPVMAKAPPAMKPTFLKRKPPAPDDL